MVGRVDAYQRRHRWAGLPLAVLYKFADDQGTYLAAQITYYGFVALFPLLLDLRGIQRGARRATVAAQPARAVHRQRGTHHRRPACVHLLRQD